MSGLVSTGDGCRVRDLLIAVDDVGVKVVVVDGDVTVGVVSDDGELEHQGEDVGGREVEGEDCGVLERELRFFRLEDRPCDEDC